MGLELENYFFDTLSVAKYIPIPTLGSHENYLTCRLSNIFLKRIAHIKKYFPVGSFDNDII